MASETRIDGLAELNKALSDLPAKIEGNIMRGALTAGLRKMQAVAKANVPTKSGDLRNSIKVRADRRALRRGQVKVSLTAGDKKAYYANMVEYGTAQHFIKPRSAKSLFFAGLAREVVDHPGSRPKPFMRPALDQGENEAILTVREYIKKRLAKEALKK
jgi:HK97 gp10 family phage protein